jgi:tRNA/tmRNA/rRNA uracil-C5-methylase (TrmA/RlmC/RlmD family)
MAQPAHDDDLLDLDVERPAAGGGFVARAPDGRVVFVRHAAPGERVRARVTADTRTYLRADAIDIVEPSPDRVEPPCPHAGPQRCGGCDYQHIALPAQRRLKAQLVEEQLSRVARLERTVEVEPMAGDSTGLGWRTRVRAAVDRSGTVGFHRHRSHNVEAVALCPVVTPRVDATGAMAVRWPGAKEIDVMTGTSSGAVVSVTRRGRPEVQIPDIEADVAVRSRTHDDTHAVTMRVQQWTYRVSAGVFWQVHQGAPAALVDAVLEAAAPQAGERAVDLFAGAGLFTLPLADAVGSNGTVLAVERDRRACADLRHNTTHLNTVSILEEAVTPALVRLDLADADIVVLDPARQGAGIPVMEALAELEPAPRTVVYVSCDPASFARDARILTEAGWDLTQLRAFDIFPMTEHVELVASFTPPT